MISTEIFEGFKKRFDVVALFAVWDGKILLLKRQLGKPQEGTWGLPAGKVGEGESLEEAVLREVFEETGIKMGINKLSRYNKTYFVRHGATDFCFYVFSTELEKEPKVKLNTIEHSEFGWFSHAQALALPLVEDQEIPTADFFKHT